MTFPAGHTSLSKTTGLETAGTCRDVFIKGTKSPVATSVQPDRRVWVGGGIDGPRMAVAESALVGSCAQALQELSDWAGHQQTLPAHSWATLGWGCCQPQGSSRVGGMRHRHPWKATGAGSHRSSLRSGCGVVMGRAPAGEQGWISSPKHTGAGKGGRVRQHWSSPTQGCVRSTPAPALSCQAAKAQPSCGRPPPIPASAWLCSPCCVAKGQEIHAASPSQGS